MAANIETAIAAFKAVLAIEKKIVIDLSETSKIDQRFFGLFLMLRKQLRNRGILLEFFGVKTRTRRLFVLNGFGDLLPESGITDAAAR